MTITQLTTQAMRVKQLFDEAARKRGRTSWTRAELAQGFSGDVGELMKLVMAKEGRRTSQIKDLQAALEHELADCLWSVLVLANAYEIKLEAAFTRTMSELEEKLRPQRRTKTARKPRGRRGSPAPKSHTVRATES